MTRTSPAARGAEARPMTEAALQRHVEAAAKQLGYDTYHTWNSMRSTPGFPDLICIRGDRLLAVELKSDKGTLTKPQDHWLYIFAQVPGCEAHLWRPSDWHDGTIIRILAGGTA